MPPKHTGRQTSKASSALSRQSRDTAATQKQPLSDADRLKRLFASLCAQIDGGHFVNAIKTCDKILRIDLRDADALQTKLFLLLQTERYAAALTLIDSVNEENGDDAFGFEKAYTLHRLHRESEATDVLESIRKGGEENRGVMHLEAQLAYREGKYQTAFDLYNNLLDTVAPHSDEQADILINLSAAQAHLDFLTSGFLAALSALPSALTDTLESAPPPAPAAPSLQTAAAQVKDARPQPQQKKPRTRRIPKGVVPGVTPPPDPERWLKKTERSSYLQAHARRRRGGGGATQGVVETPGASGPGSGTGSGGSGKGKKKGKK